LFLEVSFPDDKFTGTLELPCDPCAKPWTCLGPLLDDLFELDCPDSLLPFLFILDVVLCLEGY
jgi:hypothetical protein